MKPSKGQKCPLSKGGGGMGMKQLKSRRESHLKWKFKGLINSLMGRIIQSMNPAFKCLAYGSSIFSKKESQDGTKICSSLEVF